MDYEPWRALRNLDVPDGARERLLEGIEGQRSSSGRRGYVVAGTLAVAALALLWMAHGATRGSETARSTTEPRPSAVGQSPEHDRRTPAVVAAEPERPRDSPSSPSVVAPSPSVVAPSPSVVAPSPGTKARSKPGSKRKRRSVTSRSKFANSRHNQALSIEADELDLGERTLREQIRAYRRARDLAPIPALAAWQKHRRQWPASTLRREVDLAIISLLRQLERGIEARGEAAAFVRAHPKDRRSPSLLRFSEAP